MEELIVLVLQGLLQVLFELLAYWPWDWVWYTGPFDRANRGSSHKWGAAMASIVLGGLLGWVSLYFFPDVLIKWGWMRILLLVISPLGSGMIAREMAMWRKEMNAAVDPMFHFWLSLCFSVGLVWIRFAFAHRPG